MAAERVMFQEEKTRALVLDVVLKSRRLLRSSINRLGPSLWGVLSGHRLHPKVENKKNKKRCPSQTPGAQVVSGRD